MSINLVDKYEELYSEREGYHSLTHREVMEELQKEVDLLQNGVVE